MRLPRWLTKRGRWETQAERLFADARGVPSRPPGEHHPVFDEPARDALARELTSDFTDWVDGARAEGRWTAEMQAVWEELSEADENDPRNSDRLAELGRLMRLAGS